MNSEKFAEWQRRQGHKVVQTKNSFWFEAGPRVLQAFPYHQIISPPEKEIRDLLLRKNFVALRYSTPIDAQEGKLSYHVVKKNPYSLGQLKKRSRKSISLGLSRCSVEEISLHRLKTEGWLLQKETLIRQNRQDTMSQEQWEKLCLSAEEIPGFRTWGAIVEGNLAAFLLTIQIDDVCEFLFAGSSQKYFDIHVNHVIFYSVAQKMLQTPGVDSLFITMQSLDAPASVDDFKFRIGLDPIPVRQRIVFHPFLKPFVTPWTYKALLWLRNIFPNKNFLSKVDGMVRFYLDGKIPTDQQKLPAILQTVHNTYVEGSTDLPKMADDWKSLDQEFSK